MARYALVIGIQKYDSHDFGDLEKPAADAEAIAQVLEKYGDFTDVRRLPKSWDEQANKYTVIPKRITTERLGKEISQFLDDVGDNEALIYYSGHGERASDQMDNDEGYLVTSECTFKAVRSSLSFETINKSILKSRCTSLVLLLDCCYSASAFEESQLTSAFASLINSGRKYFFAAACRK